MPKKCTITDVELFLTTHDIDRECTLLSDTYVNGKTPMKFRCNVCGEEFERSFEKIKLGRFCCHSCAMKKNWQGRKKTIDDVRTYLLEHAPRIQLISTVYENGKAPLEMICSCGAHFTKSFEHIQSDKYILCASCAHKINGFQKKYNQEDVEEIIKPLGYTLLEPYIDAHTPVKCQCSKGHIFNFCLTGYLQDGRQCNQCAIAAKSGINAYNWRGGISKVQEYLRYSAESWRQQILAETPYCDISGIAQNLEVHHLNTNFASIVEQALQELQLPAYPQIKNYSSDELQQLKDKVKDLHKQVKGVVLTKTLHTLFHQTYGYENNTEQQYIEFKAKIRKDKLYGISNTNTTDDST